MEVTAVRKRINMLFLLRCSNTVAQRMLYTLKYDISELKHILSYRKTIMWRVGTLCKFYEFQRVFIHQNSKLAVRSEPECSDATYKHCIKPAIIIREKSHDCDLVKPTRSIIKSVESLSDTTIIDVSDSSVLIPAVENICACSPEQHRDP
jgi:hypothetical protein